MSHYCILMERDCETFPPKCSLVKKRDCIRGRTKLKELKKDE